LAEISELDISTIGRASDSESYEFMKQPDIDPESDEWGQWND